jgi:alginate O-acetyltransferase complex protein AlgJ
MVIETMSQAQNTMSVGVESSRLNDWLVVALFFGMLLVPAVAQIAGLASESSTENRTLAPFPTLKSLREVAFLPRMSESYINDRFGMRQQLVHLNGLLHFKLGLSGTKDVVIGKDGWLFYTADQLMEQHTGADIFTPAELEHWVRAMEADRDWLAQRASRSTSSSPRTRIQSTRKNFLTIRAAP